MPHQRSKHLLWGIVLLLLGALTSFMMVRNVVALIRLGQRAADPLLVCGTTLILAIGAFCIWGASNEFRRASGDAVKKPKFRWGRLLTGVTFVFFALSSYFHPGPNFLKAANAGEELGMMLETIMFVVAGLAFIAFAFQPRKPQIQPEVLSSDIQID